MARCRDCAKFIPDKVGDGSGIGQCTVFAAYKAKNPGEWALKRALVRLGNRSDNELFYGTTGERECERFLEINREGVDHR